MQYDGALSLLNLGRPPQEPPPSPEVYEILKVSRALNLPYRAGGIEDQPALLLKEMVACINAETDFKAEQEKDKQALSTFMQGVANETAQ